MEDFFASRITHPQMSALMTVMRAKGMGPEEAAAIRAAEDRHGRKVSLPPPKMYSEVLSQAQMMMGQGHDLSRIEATHVMEDILSGRAEDMQIAILLTVLRFKGETVDELVGFATAMRRHATPIFPAGYSHADRSARGHVRHRRRCFGHVQHFHGCGVRRRWRRRARGEAWQPLDQLAVRLGGRARAAWRAHRSAARARGAFDRRGRHRISFCARGAFRDAARDARAARTANAHRVQFARAADESGGSFRAGGGRLRREPDGADGARARRTWREARVRGPRRGRPGRNFHLGRDVHRRVARRSGAELLP